jgi:hypothetical protein
MLDYDKCVSELVQRWYVSDQNAMGSEANRIIRERAKVGASRTQLDNRSLARCQERSTWRTRQCRVVLRSATWHEKIAPAPASDPNSW